MTAITKIYENTLKPENKALPAIAINISNHLNLITIDNLSLSQYVEYPNMYHRIPDWLNTISFNLRFNPHRKNILHSILIPNALPISNATSLSFML